MGYRLVGALVFVTVMTATSIADPVSEAPRDVTTGSRLPAPRDLEIERGGAVAIRGAYDYGRCAVVHRGGMIRHFLDATNPVDMVKASRDMNRGELTCNGIPGIADAALARQIRMPRDIERGVFAETYLEEHAHNLSYPPLPPAKTYDDPWAPVSGRAAAVDEMAQCVAQTDPQQVTALMNTIPATSREKDAIREMVPALGGCLVAGTSLDSNSQSLRAALAEALYHRWAATQVLTEATAKK